jgi:hypothetical protein
MSPQFIIFGVDLSDQALSNQQHEYAVTLRSRPTPQEFVDHGIRRLSDAVSKFLDQQSATGDVTVHSQSFTHARGQLLLSLVYSVALKPAKKKSRRRK